MKLQRLSNRTSFGLIAAEMWPQALVRRPRPFYIDPMSRKPIAIAAGLFGFFIYLTVVVVMADTVQTMHWAVQAVYFVIAGSVWAIPVRWLMYWSVHQR